MKLKGKIAVITGGSRGIGKAVAKKFFAEGASLMLSARSADELASAKMDLLGTIEESAADHGTIEIFPADVSRKDDARALIKKTIETFGAIDILVNAAGIYGAIGPVVSVDFEKWKDAFMVNLFGTFNVIQETLPAFMEKKSGKIINFSGGGDGPLPNFSSYSSSKVGVVRLTETLAQEIKEYGITVNAVAPGAVNTNILEDALKAGEEVVGKEMYAKFLKQKEEGGVPPEKAAELCAFLASSDSDGLSGKLISAIWDDFGSWDAAKIKVIMDSNKLTLRRTPLL
jgi:NAD(P)-dependent dehydrogenase (short-subunit alcohol dehydrogenase family)